MPSASRGLVLFFIGAGRDVHVTGVDHYYVPKKTDVFIRLAAPLKAGIATRLSGEIRVQRIIRKRIIR
ncbi:hypothetical protein CLOM_g15417 [Closterium sp. NIES-68]|nr:hypothetical protein CLOM_g15417 [Closterium sp. NIES-68]